MTLPFSPSRAVYQGNGAATAFPFAFKVWSTDQLSVSITSPEGRTTPAQGWTASLGESGGTLTYLHNGAPLPDGWRLAIVRDMPFAQGIDLVSASRFDPQVIEDGLDQATAELQQLNEKITRAVIMPATSEQSPEDVVQSIYSSRNAAAASANTASAQATAAQASAQAAASSAATAAQTVQTASADTLTKATAQAQSAASSATAAALSAAEAEAASGGLAPRMDAAEQKITQQGIRLDAVDKGVAAISTILIGSVQTVLCTDSYVPYGAVPADGAEYTRAQFSTLFDDYLVGGKLLTCTYAAWTAQVAQTGNCAKFALDAASQKFKVPLLKNGDSITQAASTAELGKSYKAGLPNITGTPGLDGGAAYGTGAFASVMSSSVRPTGQYTGSANVTFDASRSNPIYGNSTTVTDEQVRLRHFVLVANAQNSASVFDWSAYMAALAGKANTDLSNATGNAFNQYLHVCDEKPSGTYGGSTSAATWQTRDLNIIRVNRIGASLANNRITLPAGRYFIRARIPCYVGMNTRCALYNYTLASYIMYSQSHFADYNYNGQHVVTLEGEFTLATDTVLEIRMRVSYAYGNGMGMATGVSGVPEIYTEALIWKM